VEPLVRIGEIGWPKRYVGGEPMGPKSLILVVVDGRDEGETETRSTEVVLVIGLGKSTVGSPLFEPETGDSSSSWGARSKWSNAAKEAKSVS